MTTARILAPTPTHLALAARTLQEGLPVALPTETVYGLAADARDATACARIFAAKDRPLFDPLIVHVAATNWKDLTDTGLIETHALTSRAIEIVRLLIDRFWPGPLTLVLPRSRSLVPDLVTSGLETVAVRSPAHQVFREVLRLSGLPLAAPSANRFGRVSPTSAEDVLKELGERIGLIVDGGPCSVGVESTVVQLDGAETLRVLRPGGVSVEALEGALRTGFGDEAPRVVGAPHGMSGSEGASQDHAQAAPGMLASHYAPRKPLILLHAGLTLPQGTQVGLLAQQGTEALARSRFLERFPHTTLSRVNVLSPTGDSAEAARTLFASLRALDESEAKLLVAEPCTSREGLAHAIQDRLARAASRA